MRSMLVLMAGMIVASTAIAEVEVYTLDKDHSTLGFASRHMMVSTVKGKFNEYSGTIEMDPADPTTAKASVTIDAKSIDTNHEKRDAHLRNEDFLEVEKFPEIKFESTGVEKGAGDEYLVKGNLTMKGVTKEITIPMKINGPINDPYGNKRIGFEGATTINRKDWGINFNATLDAGGLVVGDDVKIEINGEAIAKK